MNEKVRQKSTERRLSQQLDELRLELYYTLSEANGDQLDERVQNLSQKFDIVLNRYMRVRRT